MTTELYILTLAALLQCAQFVLMAVPTNMQVGDKTLTPRDDVDIRKEVDTVTARLIRAYDNHFESLILFAIAATVITLTDQSTVVTQACAHAYLIARLLYIPAYAQGLVPWRSLIWFVGWLSIVIMLIAALL